MEKNSCSSKYFYHNEAIAIIAIMTVLNKLKNIDLLKSLLILPFLFHKATLYYISKNSIDVNFEHLLKNKISLLSNFSDRFYSFLPITINSIIIAKDLGYLNITNNNIIISENFDSTLLNKDIGVRAKLIIDSTDNLIKILNEETSKIYYYTNIKI